MLPPGGVRQRRLRWEVLVSCYLLVISELVALGWCSSATACQTRSSVFCGKYGRAVRRSALHPRGIFRYDSVETNETGQLALPSVFVQPACLLHDE